MRVIQKFTFLFCLWIFGYAGAEPTHLFVLHNLGETNAMIPVMEKLPEDSYQILAFGKAWEKLKEHPCTLKELPHDIAVEDTLSPQTLTKVKTAANPKVLISGMASKVQAEVVNAYDAKKIFYYDNFDPLYTKNGIKEYLENFYGALKKGPYTLMVPGASHVSSARQLDKFKDTNIMALGQPSLESWEKIYAETDVKNLRMQLKIQDAQKVILYAGGFDPKDKDQYVEDLRAFIQAAASMENAVVLVTYHPKTDGSTEKAVVAEFNAPHIRIVPKGTYSTAVLSTLADVLVCFKSTVGAQAAYMGKPVLYIARNYENFLINAGVAGIATTSENIMKALKALLSGSSDKKSFSEVLGIPKNASQKIADYLKTV